MITIFTQRGAPKNLFKSRVLNSINNMGQCMRNITSFGSWHNDQIWTIEEIMIFLVVPENINA
jgi:hypothetical protein